MKQSQVARARTRVLRDLPDLHEIVRGSLLERVIRHRRGCPKCAAGDGHPGSPSFEGFHSTKSIGSRL